MLATPEYTATSYAMVTAAKGIDPAAAVGYAQSYGRLVTSDATLTYAKGAAGEPVGELRTHVRSETSPDSPMIAVTGTSADRGRAADIANAVTEAVVVSSGHVAKDTGVTLIKFSHAVPPSDPVSPSAPLGTAVGACSRRAGRRTGPARPPAPRTPGRHGAGAGPRPRWHHRRTGARPMNHNRHEPLSVTLCRDLPDFTDLAGEWDALHRRCPTATPFQSHAWLHSWWLSYGVPGRLRVLLARRGGRLIGAAPLMLVHRPMPLLVPMGGAISDFFDILVDGDDTQAAVMSLERGLHRAATHTVVDLREVRPDASAHLLFDAWSGARSSRTDSTCMELPAEPIDALIGRMSSSRGQRARAKLRRIDALGIECRTAPVHGVASAIGTLLRLHELQWLGRGINPEHLRPRFCAHLVRSTRRMVRDGEASVRQFLLDGEVVAVDLSYRSARLTGVTSTGPLPCSGRRRRMSRRCCCARWPGRPRAWTSGC